MNKELLQQALDALIESRTSNDCMEFHDRKNAAIEGLKQALAQQEPNPWADAVIDQLVVHHIYQSVHDTEPRKAIYDLLCMNQSIALDPQVSSDAQALIDRGRKEAQQEQPASVDAYVGAREDAAIWKKRALEAEELNRKFIAEVNGPTYLGEPVKQEQPTQGKCKCGHVGTSITVVESFPVHSVSVDEEDPDYKEHYHGLDVDATLQIGLEICRNCKTINGFWIEDTGGAEFYADWGKPRYTHPAPTQPALSESQITSIAYNCNALPEVITDKTLVDFVRAIEAHCRGGANHEASM